MTAVTIDGQEYKLDELSDNARAQLGSVQQVDQKLNQLQTDLAMTQTARNAYAKALSGQLPEPSPRKKKNVVTIDGNKYSLEDFSDQAKSELMSVQVAENNIKALEANLAIARTARNAYVQALKTELV